MKSPSRGLYGTSAIFCNTDYFGHFFQALRFGHKAPLQHAFERELQQNINVAKAAASPEVMKTPDRFVFSALPDWRKASKGKYTNLYHFDSKAEAINTIDDRFSALTKRMSLLHLGHFVENWNISPMLAPHKQPDGSYLFKRTFAPGFKMPFVVAGGDLGPYVKALVDLDPGKDILGVSEYMTLPDWFKLWGETLGKKATFQHVSDDQFFEGSPEPVKLEFTDTFNCVQEFGYTGGDPDIKTLDQLGVQIPPTYMREYFEREDRSSVL